MNYNPTAATITEDPSYADTVRWKMQAAAWYPEARWQVFQDGGYVFFDARVGGDFHLTTQIRADTATEETVETVQRRMANVIGEWMRE